MSTSLFYRGGQFDSNFYYFSGVDFDHSFFVASDNRKTLLTPKLNEAEARKKFDGRIIVYTDPFKELKAVVKAQEIRVDARSLSMAFFQKLRRICRPIDFSDEFYRTRCRKTPREIRKMRRAAKATKELLMNIDVFAARDEAALRKMLLCETIERGLEPAFDPIVATGKNSAFPHYRSGNSSLGDFVLVDYGVKYEKYCADLTRCYFRKKGSKEERAYNSLKQVTKSIIHNIPTFSASDQVARFAEETMKKAGLPKMIHSIGHGIGLQVHEFPRFNKKYKDKIRQSTFTIEPAVYFKDFGVRYEETVYYDNRKAVVL